MVRTRTDPRAGDDAVERRIGRFLGRRRRDDGGFEYLVKFRGVSYLHLEWLAPEEFLRGDSATLPFVRGMLKRFVRAWLAEGCSEANPQASDLFDPAFVVPDRVLACRDGERVVSAAAAVPTAVAAAPLADASGPEGSGPSGAGLGGPASPAGEAEPDARQAGAAIGIPDAGGGGSGCTPPAVPPKAGRPAGSGKPELQVVEEPMYFVKWVGQSYADCTWEWASDVANLLGGREKIAEYHARAAPPGTDGAPVAVTTRTAARGLVRPLQSIGHAGYRVRDRGVPTGQSLLGEGAVAAPPAPARSLPSLPPLSGQAW
jgi:hypothetical protein